MLVSCNMNKIERGIIKTSLCCAAAVMMTAVVSSKAESSTCYHHYNSLAWHGQGMAIVFCLNSGDYSYPGGNSLPMAACGVWSQATGERVTDFHEHSSTDHNRQVFTDPDTPGSTFGNNPLVIICRGKNGKTYSYPIANASAMSYPGTCDLDTGYIGAASQCVGDSDPLLTLKKSGPGKGTVVGDQIGLYGGKIECGTECTIDQELFYSHLDQKITMTATPDKGYLFVGWEGDCQGTETCTLTMNGDKAVTALFEEEPPVLTGSNILLLQSRRDDR